VARVDLKFFENLSELYIRFKKLKGKEKKLIIDFAKYIDEVLKIKSN